MQNDRDRRRPQPESMRNEEGAERERVLPSREARQSVRVPGMRHVLFGGIALVVLGFIVAGVLIGFSFGD